MEQPPSELTNLDEIWKEAWRPPEVEPPWQWAEKHIASIPYSPFPGRFRSDYSPWVREPLEAITNTKIRTISIIAAVQAAKTTVAELALCYIISNLPGPTLWLSATDEDAKDQSESRLQKLFDECDCVKKLFPKNPHKKRNHTIHFANGMPLWILGAHNRTNLQRRSIRWIFADETWLYPSGNMAEAEARVTAFGWLGKCIFMSQGGEENDDTHRKFETTDMRELSFACPHCGTWQAFEWGNVEWSKSARDPEGNWNFKEVSESTILRCSSCNHYFEDSDATRRQLNATGKFIPTNPNASPENVGFHWNALCSMSWGKLAELYLRAKDASRKGDNSLLQQFYQKRLALPWREYVEDYKMEIAICGYLKGAVWELEGGIDRFGKISAPPFDQTVIPLRILTVDCQMDHLFAVVRSWSANGSSRLMWNERLLIFEDIEVMQARFEIHPSLVFIDAGHATYDVYKQCARKGWIALLGDRRLTYPHKSKAKGDIQRFYSPRRKVVLGNNRFCFVHYWSNLNIKDTLASLRRNQNPQNGATWEVPDDIDEDYLSQMESEHRIKEKNVWIWKQIGHRANHYWDCESMQAAAATMLKIIGRESIDSNQSAS
jgi:phage terminase large subunit GpA-like protein